jgi:hypothetical protein
MREEHAKLVAESIILVARIEAMFHVVDVDLKEDPSNLSLQRILAKIVDQRAQAQRALIMALMGPS